MYMYYALYTQVVYTYFLLWVYSYIHCVANVYVEYKPAKLFTQLAAHLMLY